jgi:hypothetical protein
MTPGDIRDIRGPIAIPYWWISLAIGAAVVAAIALGYVLYRAIRRYRIEHAKTAAEIALERIARARELLGTTTSAAFSADVSDAVRVYIEARFSLRAAHRTTEEFLHDLLDAAASPIAHHREALEDFLSWCDLAKFARLALTAEHADSIVLAARRFVEDTRAPVKEATKGSKKLERAHSETSEVAA